MKVFSTTLIMEDNTIEMATLGAFGGYDTRSPIFKNFWYKAGVISAISRGCLTTYVAGAQSY